MMMPVRLAFTMASMLLFSSLTACDGDSGADKSRESAGSGGKPAVADSDLMASLEGQIKVDPVTTRQGHRPDARALDGAAAAPAKDKSASNGITLGELRDAQQARARSGSCPRPFDFDLVWAKRLPADAPIYPKARLTEAAGLNGATCRLRAATHVTASPIGPVIDWYHSRMLTAGFSAERQVQGKQHVLAGVRKTDGSAWYFIFSPTAEGGTEIDLIANNGQ